MHNEEAIQGSEIQLKPYAQLLMTEDEMYRFKVSITIPEGKEV